MNDPTFTFYKYKAYVNTLCLKELSESDFIEILINPRDKLLAVLPSAIMENTFAEKILQLMCLGIFFSVFLHQRIESFS